MTDSDAAVHDGRQLGFAQDALDRTRPDVAVEHDLADGALDDVGCPAVTTDANVTVLEGDFLHGIARMVPDCVADFVHVLIGQCADTPDGFLDKKRCPSDHICPNVG